MTDALLTRYCNAIAFHQPLEPCRSSSNCLLTTALARLQRIPVNQVQALTI
jgi:hypothetical protein